MNKNSSLLLSLLLAFNIGSAQLHAKDAWIDFGKNAAIAGAALAGLGGVIYLADWLFSESDEKCVARAYKTYATTFDFYNDILHDFQDWAHISNPYVFSSDMITKQWDESCLYSIASFWWNTGNYQKDYRYGLRQVIRTLESLKSSLQKRHDAFLYKDYSQKAEHLLHQMRDIMPKIESLLPWLQAFSSFCDHHKSYFELFELEGTLRNAYKRELDGLERYRHNRYVLEQELSSCIMSQKKTKRYPYVAYVKVLEKELKRLKNHVYYLAYNYAERLAYARSLIKALEEVHHIVVADSRYSQELMNIERERLEFERMELMREQARIERERLQALKDQNKILQQKIDNQKIENSLQGDLFAFPSIDVHTSFHL